MPVDGIGSPTGGTAFGIAHGARYGAARLSPVEPSWGRLARTGRDPQVSAHLRDASTAVAGHTMILDRRVSLRRILVAVCLAVVVVASCGGNESSLADYTERVKVVVDRAADEYWTLVESPEGAVLTARPDQITNYTPQDLQAALERVRQIEADVEESIDAIDPPGAVAEFHDLFFDFDAGFISAQEALAERAGAAADWYELSESSEMSAYRTALARDKEQCATFEARLNSISEQREDLADTPWLSGDLKATFEAFLGCDGYPENPLEVFRPPPAP